MQQAWQTIPHVVQYDEADITDLNSYRKKIKERESKKDVKITFLPFLMKACVKTLEKHPIFNSSLDIEENNQIALTYCNSEGKSSENYNPNGAIKNIAGIFNKEKNVLGMMPHPERMIDKYLSGEDGSIFFENLIRNVK